MGNTILHSNVGCALPESSGLTSSKGSRLLLRLLPFPGCVHKRLEEPQRRLIAFKATLGALHGQNVVPGLRAFNRFNHSVVGTAGGDAQAVAFYYIRSLMMAGVPPG